MEMRRPQLMDTDKVDMNEEGEPLEARFLSPAHLLVITPIQRWCSLLCVQIMDTDRVEMNEEGEPLEAVLTGSKCHPNLVSTIGWCAC